MKRNLQHCPDPTKAGGLMTLHLSIGSVQKRDAFPALLQVRLSLKCLNKTLILVHFSNALNLNV